MDLPDSDRFTELPDEDAGEAEADDAFYDAQDELSQAQLLKESGNQYFVASCWDQALTEYRDALVILPDRPLPPDTPHDDAPEAEDAQVRELRATLHANVAAAHLKKEQWKEAVAAATDALADNPTYEKAIHRRAVANERIGSWTSLEASLKDWTTLQTLTPTNQLLHSQAKAAVARLPPRIEEAKKKETDEMLGKLKDLGNSFLGKFGLSTDNFVFTQNPDGGQSISMKN